ncbi:hypothetical protein SETIT_2G103400v2 [Setaria italica]|uniref:AAA+ ATPase domain-containing protein n=1 Tax=Setaria italica TaxID=4555 RepID=K4A3F6_SETIT|nr:hypothetical protein SETIT_2G103400v2 [Setaria italica]
MERAMVSVATGAMSSVLTKLAELLHEEYKLAKGVRNDIEFLRSELGVMNDLLYVMADIEELDALNKGWRDRVRELAYNVEDCIDLSVARFRRADGDASKGGKLKKIRVSLQIAHQIQELKARVIEESDRQKRYKLDGLIGSSSDASRNKVDLRMCALWEETKNLVGLDGPRDEIIRLLMPAEGEVPSQQVRTLSIVGCAGLGKTTLTNQVYQKIQGHFECKAFVSVSQNPHIKDILMKICSQVGATPSMADDELLLVNKLREYISVVDDIWHSDPWKIIGQALVRTSPGSIIIVTTRLKDVAESCCSSHGGHVYDMRPLDNNDSRRLFFKRIFDSEDKCRRELERASEDILEKCDGIPLAIISISSFLAVDVPQSADHWNKVKESISSPLPRNKAIETMHSVLSLSYFNLPHHQRTCLLYLTAFPEDCIIVSKLLISRWIAEGFVNAELGESLYEAGLRYFNDLINRSLIQPWHEVRGVVLSCRVHDVILNFLISKSVEENFLTLSDPSRLPTSLHSKVRRLSLKNNCQENVVSWIMSIKPYVRSLACFVLLQLRYLNIKGTGVGELPAGIGQVQNLETLDISLTEVEKLPSTIVQLEKLARLFVSPKVMIGSNTIPMDSSFPTLQSLRTFIISTISSLPIWMGLLVNLELLQLETKRFTPEDLRVLGGMPALETLILVGELYQILFMPGAMPNLKHLKIRLAFTTNSYSDLGIQHIASLTRVDVGINAWCDHREAVQDPEAKTQSLLDAHPNRPTLIFNTDFLDDRYSLKGLEK